MLSLGTPVVVIILTEEIARRASGASIIFEKELSEAFIQRLHFHGNTLVFAAKTIRQATLGEGSGSAPFPESLPLFCSR